MNEQRTVKQSMEAVIRVAPGYHYHCMLDDFFGLAEVVTGFTHNFFRDHHLQRHHLHLFICRYRCLLLHGRITHPDGEEVGRGACHRVAQRGHHWTCCPRRDGSLSHRFSQEYLLYYRWHGHRGSFCHLHWMEVEILRVNGPGAVN